MTGKAGLLKRLADAGVGYRAWMTELMAGKEVVGTHDGNQYRRWKETFNGQTVERREVKWAAPYMMYNPHDIPSEWRMWLIKKRDNPPTPEELEKSASQAAVLKGRVEAIEVQEALRRVRQAAQGAQAARPGSSGPDLSKLLQQVQQQPPQPGSEATGRGESFTPGQWKPDK
mmetsp:Transcript_7371/g.12716  ORF Transcript_7371/g.12716 Transcript_7371/m.12716 type:complete len:172 (-) Transcript_7371:523-1038(-)